MTLELYQRDIRSEQLHLDGRKANGSLSLHDPANYSHLKQLFFSGQFTDFIQQLMSSDHSFFVDGIHMALALMNLNLMKTKP